MMCRSVSSFESSSQSYQLEAFALSALSDRAKEATCLV